MWNFFATSHGKNACDGIGWTVKQLATDASLMVTEKKHILIPLDLFDWASKNICNIGFISISAEEITEHCQQNLNECYGLAKAEKGLGTRSHHCYKPISTNSLEIRRVSSDDIFSQWCSLKRLLKCLPMISLHLESTLLVSMMMSAT